MPRKSAAARAMEPLIPHEEPVPVQPPPSLSEAARAVFLDLVSSCHPDHFKQSDVTMLAQYCEAASLAARSAAELQSGGDHKTLLLWEKATRTMSNLALRLRLGPQSSARRPRSSAR
jgi:phage terminase small subunit